MALGSDFRRLWAASAASQAGSGIGFGALPLVAILILQASTWQVSLLATISGLAAAAVALPAGPWIEFRRKRPMMIGADVVRAGALLSVPVALAFGLLTYAQLAVVAVVQACGAIVFAAASGAHLKALVAPADRAEATGRLEATFWTTNSVGPPLGGALTSWVGVGWTITVDALSFLGSAFGVRQLRGAEPEPPARTVSPDRAAEILAGWRYVFGHAGLRALFLNSQLFGGAMMAASPLLGVLMLRDLGFPAWQYGVAWGVPCLGGVLGALALKPLTRRYGERRVMLASGVGRAVWLCLLAAMPAGPGGLALVIVVETLALFGSGVFNPAFATYRLTHTEDGHVARVISCWSITSRVAQPIGIAAGGALAAATSVRVALLVCGVGCLASAVLLPWRRNRDAEPDTARRGQAEVPASRASNSSKLARNQT
ncbi:MFS transporter [Mangrovihabitans endophyticus]|uniref:MFS transporter n=1 Tax=Mangrovihabitans endophyticus TaxID=1751298 RepID=A0A8J3FNI5_9ACTN|nr:MFS transporter [Mangrovihabitans endophyticus]GGK93169.1 MFS transporter [Mangrovihabitans endophyticus]